MKIHFQSQHSAQMQHMHSQLNNDLVRVGMDNAFNLNPVQIHQLDGIEKGGEVIELATILLVAVGAGGAFTVAMGKDGFLTQLAKVLEKYVSQEIEIQVEDKKGNKKRLSGSAGHIRQLLKDLDNVD